MVFHINLKIPVGPNLFTENSRNVGENLVSENFRSNPGRWMSFFKIIVLYRKPTARTALGDFAR